MKLKCVDHGLRIQILDSGRAVHRDRRVSPCDSFRAEIGDHSIYLNKETIDESRANRRYGLSIQALQAAAQAARGLAEALPAVSRAVRRRLPKS